MFLAKMLVACSLGTVLALLNVLKNKTEFSIFTTLVIKFIWYSDSAPPTLIQQTPVDFLLAVSQDQ